MAALTLDQAMARAAAMKQLRNVEMDDARECYEDLATAREHRLPQPVCDRYLARVRAHVQAARKWNRQLIIAERAIREALLRQNFFCRRFVPLRQAVRP